MSRKAGDRLDHVTRFFWGGGIRRWRTCVGSTVALRFHVQREHTAPWLQGRFSKEISRVLAQTPAFPRPPCRLILRSSPRSNPPQQRFLCSVLAYCLSLRGSPPHVHVFKGENVPISGHLDLGSVRRWGSNPSATRGSPYPPGRKAK